VAEFRAQLSQSCIHGSDGVWEEVDGLALMCGQMKAMEKVARSLSQTVSKLEEGFVPDDEICDSAKEGMTSQ